MTNIINKHRTLFLLADKIKLSCLLLLAVVVYSSFFPRSLHAQTIPVGDIREDQIRIQQLFQGTGYSSFTNRPVWYGVYDQYMDHTQSQTGWWNRKMESPEFNAGDYFKAGIYEPYFQTTSNSAVPYGENNGAAWYGKGLNTEFHAGVWLTSDYLTVTLRPHVTFSENRYFQPPRFVKRDEDGNQLYSSEGMGYTIDLPYRFGPDSYSTSSWSHSSIRVHYEHLEIGYSNEALWWGGNVKYPLMMSNNAPGVRHVFAGTRKPIRIPYVGAIEFRWIGGFPEDSEYFEAEEEYRQDRFLNAVNFTYSPFFVPNLHIGFTRAFHTYLEDGKLQREDLSMIFDPFYLKNFIEKNGPLNENKPRNYLHSVYLRWVWPESRTEIYGEFFRDDYSWDSRDFLMEPRHNSGYAFGFQSLIPGSFFADFYKINMEFTNMTPSFLEEVRPQIYYYSDQNIRQGHTHRGQLLGAAIQPGSNSQFLSVDALVENGKFGIFIRRLANNNQFHYAYDRFLDRPEEFRQGYGDYWRNRTDLTIGANAMYLIGPLKLAGTLSWTKLFNYGRYDYGLFGPGISVANFENYDLYNIQLQFSAQYRF